MPCVVSFAAAIALSVPLCSWALPVAQWRGNVVAFEQEADDLSAQDNRKKDVSLITSGNVHTHHKNAAHTARLRRQVEDLRSMTKCAKDSPSLRASAEGGELAFAGQSAVTGNPDRPKYSFEPLLDVDFILDADNYLEDFIHADSIPQELADKYVAPAGTETAATTEATSATTTTPTALSAATARVDAAGGIVTFVNCFTRPDPRIERKFQFLLHSRPAPTGALCLFGTTPRDEGGHCVWDQGKFGSFGWCYTKEDRSEWGSCVEGCPLSGSVDTLADRIEKLSLKVQSALYRLNATQCLVPNRPSV